MHCDRNPVTDFRILMYTPFYSVLKLDQKIVLFDIRTNYYVPVDSVLPKPWYMCKNYMESHSTRHHFSYNCCENLRIFMAVF